MVEYQYAKEGLGVLRKAKVSQRSADSRAVESARLTELITLWVTPCPPDRMKEEFGHSGRRERLLRLGVNTLCVLWRATLTFAGWP